MNRMIPLSIATLLLLLASSQFANAHPGGLDEKSAHVDNSTGIHLCHPACCVVRSGDNVENRSAASNPKFNRNEWGNWKDLDGDCQDSRAEVLQRDSSIPVTFTNNKSCAVARGQWHDPYTGDQFNRSLSLDIDHIVP